MAEFEIRGGAGPYEAAAIVAVFNRLLAEASAARSARPALPVFRPGSGPIRAPTPMIRRPDSRPTIGARSPARRLPLRLSREFGAAIPSGSLR